MTIHIQMLQDIATHARAMADSMQAIVDDCAEQLARRKAAGESEESIMNEPFNKAAQNGFTPYEGPTPFDEKPKNYGGSRFGTEADHRGTARLCGGALYPGEPPEDQGDSHPVRREEAHRASGKPV